MRCGRTSSPHQAFDVTLGSDPSPAPSGSLVNAEVPLAAIQCDQTDHLLFATIKYPVGVASGHALGAGLQESFELCFALNLWDPLLSTSGGIVKALDDEHGP